MKAPLPKLLPTYSLRTRWIMADRLGSARGLAEAELERATRAPGWNPKVVAHKGAFCIIDVCGCDEGLHSAKIALIQDHPFLKVLERLPHVPRAVKSLFRKEKRLGHYRATDALPVLADIDRARVAWAEWLANHERAAT